jgi:cyclophilin family peptidyl-prolyl cis-trans isomerase
MKKLVKMFCGLCLAFAVQANVRAQTITNQPRSVTVNNASTAMFTVGAAGATNYQWQFDGTNLSDGENITGSTNSTLTLEDLNSNQMGTYTVILNGSVTSSNAVLIIVPGTIVTFALSGFISGGASNVDVQLFDHDKPATVENFIHYIIAGAYTNMFFDRCIPGSMLQGGDYGASNQTMSAPPVTGWSINQQFTENDAIEPPFPPQVANEFNVGPVIHNRFGTIAMALASGKPNSASNAFFFNLTDNSTSLDAKDFTVFGRILDGTNEMNGGTNVLDYFNTLTNKRGIITNAKFSNAVTSITLSNLPVNFAGTNAPANSNLVFCDFSFQTTPPVDTNPPTVSITSPVSGVLLTNDHPVVQGTANDDVGVAVVICVLIPQAAADGTYPNGNVPITNYAVGTTNWSVTFTNVQDAQGLVPPGSYSLSVQSQDGAGNLSMATNQPLMITAVITNGDGTVTLTNGGTNLNAVGYPFQNGTNYDLVATAVSNQVFVSWIMGAQTHVYPDLSFSMSDGAFLKATFISNGIPDSIAFAYPMSNAVLSTNTFNISGTISNVASTPVTVTCQIYSATTFLAVGSPLKTSGVTNWTVTAKNLPNGSYSVEATAVDSAGHSTVLAEDFTDLQIAGQPQSVTVNNASTATFSVLASNVLTYQWQFQGTNITGATNSTLTLEDVNSNQMGNYTVVLNGVATSSPPAELTIVPGTIVTFTVTNFLGGGASNVEVQLFDHDKPATVQNFIHYISSGAFTNNMFFERCIPGFVLQGGSYGTSNRTGTNPPIYGWDVAGLIASNQFNPPFPPQVDSEFNVGPLIKNDFGTLAMALSSSEFTGTLSNSAQHAFFFNLADNSGSPNNLDSTANGPFTVFGRVISGTNVLEYFNSLTNGHGIVTNEVLLENGSLSTNPFPNLPVNYTGTNAPANSSLVFCDFQLPANVLVDTNPPTVSVTSPAPNAVLTNGNPVIQGTASDDVGLAVVICALIPQTAADGTYPNGGISITNYAVGTTNWSVNFMNSGDSNGLGLVPPGSYILSVQSQDGAGNLSPITNQSLIITAIAANGGGTLTFTQGAYSNLNAVGYPFQVGTNYSVKATAGTNQIFVNWTGFGINSINPDMQFTMQDGLVLNATFISNNIPDSIAFTYPLPNATIGLGPFNITGTISNVQSAEVTCQIYSATTYQAVGLPLTDDETTAWSVSVSSLPADSYTVEAIAVDPDGDSTMITEDFTVTTNTEIINQPQSVTVNNVSTAAFTIGAINALTYQWQFQGSNIFGATNAILTLEDVTSNQIGDYTVVIDNSLTSSPPAVLTIVPGTIVTFTFSGFIGGGATNVSVQLFDHDKPATVENFLHYITSGAFTNMFFERCLPGFVLQGGDYGASNQTDTNPPMSGWDIQTEFTMATNESPPFPPQVDSEFNVGPLIHNDFGTVAMALVPGDQDSATSGFFFNLADNSTNLDAQNGGFTVFGRILDETGTNVLEYFNTLTNDSGVVTNAEFFDEALQSLNQTITNLPVNYDGSNAPANANLVFCGFRLPTNVPVDTNSPTVSITSPAPNAVVTNGNPTIQGTASDDVALAVVIGVLIPQPAPDGTDPNGGVAITNYAIGTTNWSLNFTNSDDPNGSGLVPPGSYILSVRSQDGAGNLSTAANQPLIITAVGIDGDGTVTFINDGTNFNAVGYPFQDGSDYNLAAMAGTNQVFLNWIYNGQIIAVNPELPLPMSDGTVVTATFITNGIPDSIAFTYPPPNAIIGTHTFDITGTISNAPLTPLTVTCYIYSTTTYKEAADSPLTSTGTTNWSVTVSNLPPDSYAVEAMAVDISGNSTAISEDFTVATNGILGLDVVGPGSVSGPTNGESILVGLTLTNAAVPDPGQLFYTWSNNVTGEVSMDPIQTNTMAGGLTLTATFVSNTMPNSIAFTSPPADVVLSNGDVQVSGTLSNVPSPPVTVTCQIFSQTNLLAVSSAVTTIGTTNWSVIIGDLGAGSYIALVEGVDSDGNSTLTNETFNAVVDTNEPSVSILYPLTNAILPDSHDVTANGTASDSLGLALVVGSLVPTNAPDGTVPNGGNYFSVNGFGTTNWSMDFGIVPPGPYVLYVYAQDNAGNVGLQTQPLTNTAIIINGSGNVTLTQGGIVKPNPVGYPLQYGTAYNVEATPDAGQTFVGWSQGAYTTTNPAVTFTNSAGVLWTATFIPSNTGKGISFSYPAANARLATNSFLLKGRMTSSYKSARVSCQISSLTTAFGVGPLMATSGPTTWSTGISNLPPDDYVVVATATNGAEQSTSISEKFSVFAFADVTGTYTGLFISTNGPVAPTNSGFFTFTVGPSGVFTGKLVFPAFVAIPIYPLEFGNIDFTTGMFSTTISENVPEKPLSLTIYLDLTGGSDIAVGTISSKAWSSQLICYRAVTKLSSNTAATTGKYIFSLQAANQTNAPYTNGYAAFTIAKNGSVALSGALPDNTAFSQSAKLSKEGIWPLYAIPDGDKNQGMLMGWETNSASGNCSGQVYWYKAPSVGAYFTGGIGVVSNMFLNSTGTNYSRPVTGSQYSIVFEGGTLATPLTNILVANDAGQFVVSGSPADKLKISLSANGVLAGSILNPADSKTLRFKGAFISPSQGGSGFIPDAGGMTGCFELELEPQ